MDLINQQNHFLCTPSFLDISMDIRNSRIFYRFYSLLSLLKNVFAFCIIIIQKGKG